MSGKKARESREQAREIAAKYKPKKSPARHLKWALPVAAVAVIGTIGAFAFSAGNNEFPDAGPVPASGNIHGGIIFGAQPASQSLTVDSTKLANAKGEHGGITIRKADGDEPVQVIEYIDLNCVHCAGLYDDYGPGLEFLAKNGSITLETRTVGFLDSMSPTNFSSRAANAAACVADAAPEKHHEYISTVLAAHDEGEQTNAQLTETAAGIGVTGIGDCVKNGTFRPFVEYTTTAAQTAGVMGTPSLVIDGKVWDMQGSPIDAIGKAAGL